MPGSTVNFRYFILGLLTQQPMSGYDIKRFLKSLSWLIGSPSFGSLYPALHALHKDGLVTVDVQPRQDKPPRKIYSTTKAGRQLLKEWINQPAKSSTPLKAFLMRLILATNFTHAILIAHLQQRRAQVADHQAALEQAVSTSDKKTNLKQCLAMDYGAALAAAESAWLDSTLARLSQLSQQPLPTEVAEGDSVVPTV
jgi:PadR family transcriptional regulator AphA